MSRVSRAGQAGFTIIELIVVILLLGILTATALPRFMDVTDEAHAAVVDAVRGGLASGQALFHAQWVAEGEPVGVAIAEFNSMEANVSGYPVGLDADTGDALSDNTECLEIFNGLLQEGRPSAAEDTGNSLAASITQADIDFVAGSDILAQFTATNICTYAYIGQFTDMSVDTIPTLLFNVSTGAVTTGNL